MKAIVMNARVFLLVLVTGLFMAAWDGDQAAMEAAIVRRDTRIANARIALLQEQTGEVRTASIDQAHTLTTPQHSLTVSPVSDSAGTPASVVVDGEQEQSAVPLPTSIAAGDYQAINQSTGESRRICIEDSDASNQSQRDFYTVDGDAGERWYLIRIAAESTSRQ